MIKCETCGRAIRWYTRRSAWAHAVPGSDHPPIPPLYARADRLTFGRDRMPEDEATTAPAWPPLGFSDDD